MAMTKEWERKVDYYLKTLPALFFVPVGELHWEGFVTKERLHLAQAKVMPRHPMPEGASRGEKWEYAWLFATVTVPEDCAGQRLVIKSDNGEGIVWIDGKIVGAFDREHDGITLTQEAKAGQIFEITQEAYAGHGVLLQAYGAAMDPPIESGWAKPHPFGIGGNYPKQVKNGCWGLWDEDVFQAWMDLSTLCSLREALAPLDQRRVDIEKGLVEACRLVDLGQPSEKRRQTILDMAAELKPLLKCHNSSTAATMYAFGHAHLDLQWLWTDAETRRKIARTVGNQLQLIKEYPEYRYLQSQPWLMDVLKKEYPDLYEEFKAAVKAGNIIVDGSTWVEPDVNLPSGESLVRQFLYGKQFLKEEFGVDSKVMWLPDSFGCSGSLPQIMKGCGISYFFSAKFPWIYNDGEIFPMTSFNWRGIDDTQILSHVITNYGAPTKPLNVVRLWAQPTNYSIETGIRALPFGHSDGGGGATRLHLEYAKREADLEGMPKIVMSSPEQFYYALEKQDIPGEYNGELYYPNHRGTYTAQAKTKMWNRRAEQALRNAEMLDALFGTDDRDAYEEQWKTVLFHQFHDDIPGSSIAEVYEITEKELEAVANWAADRTQAALTRAVEPRGKTVTLMNSLSWPRKALVALPEGSTGAMDTAGLPLPTQQHRGQTFALVSLPACGTASVTLTEEKAPASLADTGLYLENDRIRVQFDQMGQIVSIVDLETGFETLRGKANQFRMFADMPLFCEAWDIDSHYETQPVELPEPAVFSNICRGPLFSSLTITRKLNHSVMTQTVTLRQGTKQLDFATKVDWQETQKLLKVYFDTNFNTDELYSETQFGYLKRPAHRSTPYARDRFEVCQHKWSAFVENKRIFAVLNDCKYGVGAKNGEMGLTLLKSPMAPAVDADKGLQEFTYSLLLAEDLTQVTRAGCELNTQVPMVPGWRPDGGVFTVSAENVVIDTVKKAEDGTNAVVLRLYESINTMTSCTLHTSLPVKEAWLTNLLEEQRSQIPVENGDIRLQLRGFEIVTLKLKL